MSAKEAINYGIVDEIITETDKKETSDKITDEDLEW